MFGVGRLGWWAAADERGLPGPIPAIMFRDASDNAVDPDLAEVSQAVAVKQYKGPPLSAQGAVKHLTTLIDRMGGSWAALDYLIRWLAWGLGVSGERERPPSASSWEPHGQSWDELLYRDLHLGRLQSARADVLGCLLSEKHSKGWNPNGFYPTPMSVSNMMAQTVFNDTGDELSSICDPCVGTGRLLLASSNFSVNLYGADIDALMVDACSVNLALFAPWGVYLSPGHRALLKRGRPCEEHDQERLAAMSEARVAQGHPALPVSTEGKYTFNKHGQGELFSLPPAPAKKGKAR